MRILAGLVMVGAGVWVLITMLSWGLPQGKIEVVYTALGLFMAAAGMAQLAHEAENASD